MISVYIASLCYIITSLSDKYCVSKGKLNGNELTFIMALATAVFMTPVMIFSFTPLAITWQAILAIVLIAGTKLGEFKLSAIILLDMSAFELKAWLGLTLIITYFSDIAFYGETFSVLSLMFIILIGVGLFFIAKANGEKVNYKKIALPLIFYLVVRFAYGIVMKEFAVYMPSDMILYFALILLAIGFIPFIKYKGLFTEKKKGTIVCILTKIPNAIGLYAENAAIAFSLTGFMLITPIILVALFIIGLFRKENANKFSILGGIISIIGIIGFQFFK